MSDNNKNNNNGEGEKAGTTQAITVTVTDPSIPDATGRCFFPDNFANVKELQQMILRLAVTESYTIEPKQVKPGSNKFDWCYGSTPRRPVLTAIKLSCVSKGLYDAVCNTHLLYISNRFFFKDLRDMATYLVALTPERQAFIQSISLQIGYLYAGSIPKNIAYWSTLSTCMTLRHLKLTVDGYYYDGAAWKDFGDKFFPTPDFRAIFSGLDNFELRVVYGVKEDQYEDVKLTEDKVMTEADTAATATTATVAKAPVTPRDELVKLIKLAWKDVLDAKQNKTQLRNVHISDEQRIKVRARLGRSAQYLKAVELVNLTIDGDGRLGEDRKPNQVSSRTRGSRNATIAADGTIVKTADPKFNADGELLWVVDAISDSREIDDEFGVEFKCRFRRNNCLSVIPGESWESLGVINNCAESRGEIVRFYRAFPANFGLQAVCDLWAIGGKTANIPKNYTGRGYHKRFSEQADAENPDALLLETTKQDLADILRLYKRDIKAAEDEAKRVADLKAAKKVVSGKKGKKGGKK